MKIRITSSRAQELQNLLGTTKHNFEFEPKFLTQDEFKKLKEPKRVLLKIDDYGWCFLYSQESETFLDGITDVQKVIYSTLKEVAAKRKNDYKNIEAVVDILQETNNKNAKKILAVYEVQKAMEVIKKYRKELLNLDNDTNLQFEKGRIFDLKNPDHTVFDECDLKDIPVEKLLELLVSEMRLPTTLKIL